MASPLETMFALNIILVVALVAMPILFFKKIDALEDRLWRLDNYLCRYDTKIINLEHEVENLQKNIGS